MLVGARLAVSMNIFMPVAVAVQGGTKGVRAHTHVCHGISIVVGIWWAQSKQLLCEYSC